jgi:hypothetical protein
VTAGRPSVAGRAESGSGVAQGNGLSATGSGGLIPSRAVSLCPQTVPAAKATPVIASSKSPALKPKMILRRLDIIALP